MDVHPLTFGYRIQLLNHFTGRQWVGCSTSRRCERGSREKLCRAVARLTSGMRLFTCPTIAEWGHLFCWVMPFNCALNTTISSTERVHCARIAMYGWIGFVWSSSAWNAVHATLKRMERQLAYYSKPWLHLFVLKRKLSISVHCQTVHY